MTSEKGKRAGRWVGAKADRRAPKTVVRSASTGRFMAPKAGSTVKVSFGRREVDGVVVGKTITGRYSVRVAVPGADTPVTTTYAADELRSAAG